MIDKDSLRRELLRRRDAIPPEVRKVKDRSILERLLSLEEIKRAGLLFFFASFRSEVDTMEAVSRLLRDGRRIAFPKVERQARSLNLYEVKDIAELTKGCLGIPEPSLLAEERMVDINSVDVVIIPGAGFDAEGNRIGYGGGYYDRLLSSMTRDVPVIAPTYEEQVVESIPAEPHDMRVDMIVTDRRVIRCATNPL